MSLFFTESLNSSRCFGRPVRTKLRRSERNWQIEGFVKKETSLRLLQISFIVSDVDWATVTSIPKNDDDWLLINFNIKKIKIVPI